MADRVDTETGQKISIDAQGNRKSPGFSPNIRILTAATGRELEKNHMFTWIPNFVRAFFHVHTDFRVRREDIYWRCIAAGQVAAGLPPEMQTHISTINLDQRWQGIHDDLLALVA